LLPFRISVQLYVDKDMETMMNDTPDQVRSSSSGGGGAVVAVAEQ
jgi:hypothetical protein